MKHNKVIALLMLMFPLGVHAQEFIRADNIYDLAFIAQNGDNVRFQPKKKYMIGTRYYYRHIRNINANECDRTRRNALPDTLADRILLSDTIFVKFWWSSPDYVLSFEYGETWSFSGELYGYIGGYGKVEETWSEDENMRRILDGQIVYSDSIPWFDRATSIYILDKYIRILPGLYEHTTYQYAINHFTNTIYYGPMDNQMDE